MTAASHPAIEALRAKVGGSEPEMTAAAIDALLDAQSLKTVDDFFAFTKPWNGKDARVSEAINVGQAAFLFNFKPERLSPQKVALQTAIFRTKETGGPRKPADSVSKELLDAFATGKVSAGMEKILDQTFELEIGNPVIVAIPTEGGAYFMMIVLKGGAKSSGQLEFAGGPKVIHRVTPAYPDELRRQGVEGQVDLQVGIDEEGTVGGVKILKSLHPYLDNAAVQALKQWKYEPVYQNGVPVPAIITMTVNFTREAYRAQEEAEESQKSQGAAAGSSSQAELAGILEKCAEYCDKLKGAALDYICEETIRDVFYNLMTQEERKKSSVVLSMVSGAGSVSRLGISDLPPYSNRTEKNEYVCDYLLIKNGEGIEDKRIILKENGRKIPDRTKFLEEKRFATLLPYLAPVRLVGRDRQRLFDYRLLDLEKVKGKDAYLIEAIPKAGAAAGVEYAGIWVEKKNFRVLKIEITGVPIEGYESVLEELIQYNIKTKFVTTYSYLVEKKGLAFPSGAAIRVNYPFPGMTPELYNIEKIRTDIKYDKYKFFTVETDGAVKKQGGEGLKRGLAHLIPGP
ncbi:MAG: TonB family protein [Candidatus Aminicenantales bacterium]